LFLGIGTLLLCVFWCFFGLMMFWAAAVGLDGRGAGLDHPDFIKVYVVFGGGLLGGLWFAFRSFMLAFRARRNAPVGQKTAPPEQSKQEKTAGDERLAHLVK